jgi:hypothetical protein
MGFWEHWFLGTWDVSGLQTAFRGFADAKPMSPKKKL